MEAKQVTDMMEAYASIYEKSEEQVIDEDLQGAVEKGLDAAAKNPVVKAIGKVIAPVGKGRKTPTKTSGGYRPVAKEEVEIIDEKIATGTGKKVMPSAEERSRLAKRARAGEDIGKKGPGFEAVAKKAAERYGSEEAGKRVAAAAMFKQQAHKEEVEVDLFDIILEYLVAEGYADTNENALVIMANMSEDWRQSIVEDIRGNSTLTPVGKAIGTGVGILKGAMGAIKSGGGYSTRPGDGKPYKDGPLWGPGSSSTPKTPVKKPSSQAPMRDEPLW